MEAQCTSKELPSSCGSASTVSHAAPDDVLQSTMTWLFLTIACFMCATEKSGANPEVSMDVVSPFLSCLVVQVTCAVVIRARPTAPGCLPRGLAPGFYQRFVSLLLRTRFMADIYGGIVPSQQVWSGQPSQAQSSALCAAPLLIATQKVTVLHQTCSGTCQKFWLKS